MLGGARIGLLLGGVVACAAPAEPDPCAEMCAAAAELYGACLEDWGVGWEGAGYEDREDFVDACHTWAGELRLLVVDAVDRGVAEEVGAVDAVCQDRDAAMRAPDATCEAYTGVDWNQVPWEEEP